MGAARAGGVLCSPEPWAPRSLGLPRPLWEIQWQQQDRPSLAPSPVNHAGAAHQPCAAGRPGPAVPGPALHSGTHGSAERGWPAAWLQVHPCPWLSVWQALVGRAACASVVTSGLEAGLWRVGLDGGGPVSGGLLPHHSRRVGSDEMSGPDIP